MIGTATLATAAARAARAMEAQEDALNAADGRIGDGDTGQTMRRVSAAVAGASGQGDDLGARCTAMSIAAAGATGSSLGTLVALGLRAMGKALAGRAEVDATEMAGALEAAETTMLARGQVSLGDKTAIDMLHAVRSALGRGGTDIGAVVQETLDAFRDRPCRAGRAGRFGDRTVGLDDPGMLAFAHVARAIAAGDGTSPDEKTERTRS